MKPSDEEEAGGLEKAVAAVRVWGDSKGCVSAGENVLNEEESMVLRRATGGGSGICSSAGPSGEAGDMGLFSSWSLFSSPSTRLSRASRTSVLGPRFLGIASFSTTEIIR